MTVSFDPTLKALVETAPEDWLTLLGFPPAPVAVLDADIATVITGAADKVLRVGINRLTCCTWTSRRDTIPLAYLSGCGCIIQLWTCAMVCRS
jgi:hypothetical protein